MIGMRKRSFAPLVNLCLEDLVPAARVILQVLVTASEVMDNQAHA